MAKPNPLNSISTCKEDEAVVIEALKAPAEDWSKKDNDLTPLLCMILAPVFLVNRTLICCTRMCLTIHKWFLSRKLKCNDFCEPLPIQATTVPYSGELRDNFVQYWKEQLYEVSPFLDMNDNNSSESEHETTELDGLQLDNLDDMLPSQFFSAESESSVHSSDDNSFETQLMRTYTMPSKSQQRHSATLLIHKELRHVYKSLVTTAIHQVNFTCHHSHLAISHMLKTKEE